MDDEKQLIVTPPEPIPRPINRTVRVTNAAGYSANIEYPLNVSQYIRKPNAIFVYIKARRIS